MSTINSSSTNMLPRSARKSADSWVSWVGWRRSSQLTRSSNCTEPLYSHTSYIALNWRHCGIKNANKLDKLNERALRFVFNDVTLTYDKLLRTPSLADRRMQDYRIFTYKAPNNQAPRYIRALLEERSQYNKELTRHKETCKSANNNIWTPLFQIRGSEVME